MTDTTTDTTIQAVETLAPTVLAIASATNPNVAAVAELAPVALDLLNLATQLHEAGAMTPDQLVALFATVSQGIQTSHDQWVALNAKSNTATVTA